MPFNVKISCSQKNDMLFRPFNSLWSFCHFSVVMLNVSKLLYSERSALRILYPSAIGWFAVYYICYFRIIWTLVKSGNWRPKSTTWQKPFEQKAHGLIPSLIGSFIWHQSHFMSIKLTIHLCVVFNNNITEDLHDKSRYIDVSCEQCNYREKSSEKQCLTILNCFSSVWISTINTTGLSCSFQFWYGDLNTERKRKLSNVRK